jgi:hypothetical protein
MTTFSLPRPWRVWARPSLLTLLVCVRALLCNLQCLMLRVKTTHIAKWCYTALSFYQFTCMTVRMPLLRGEQEVHSGVRKRAVFSCIYFFIVPVKMKSVARFAGLREGVESTDNRQASNKQAAIFITRCIRQRG